MNDSFEAQYAAAADRVLNGTGREAFDAMKTLKVADPARYAAENGADYPAQSVRPGAETDRAAHQSRRRARGGVCRARRMGHAREPGLGAGTARHPARRLRAQHRRARHRPRRSDGGHRRVDDVGVRSGGERERQPRHRSRSRQRDARHRRRRSRRPGVRQVARARRRQALRGPRSRGHDRLPRRLRRDRRPAPGRRDPKPIFPGYSVQPSKFPGLFA